MYLASELTTPASAADAVAMAKAGLAWLASANVSELTVAEQADCLRELERTASLLTAARTAVLTAFTAADGYEYDGHGSTRTWLKWQTRVTGGAAARVIGWMRRLAAHPSVRDDLAAGRISASWASQICDWTDLLPESVRAKADLILLAVAATGAEMADLAGLAEEMRRRTAPPDTDGDDGFDDRWVRLGITFRGTGRLDGGLTPQCAAAVAAVLDALGKKAGPEDTRSRRQRDHDALEEAMRRLIAAGFVPDRAGQPTQIQLHMTLDQLRQLDRDGDRERTWLQRSADDGRLGIAGSSGRLPGPQAGPGAACDATVVPIVSGDIDHGLLDELVAVILSGDPMRADVNLPSPNPASPGPASRNPASPSPIITHPASPGPASPNPASPGPANPNPISTHPAGPGSLSPASASASPRPANADSGDRADRSSCDAGLANPWRRESRADQARPDRGLDEAARFDRSRNALRQILISRAADLLSGPAGLASYLRYGLSHGAAATPSLPLDIGSASDTLPAHLRRAVIARDRHCRFPGCDQAAAACQPHHIVPRADGGPHSLSNLLLLCSFHHLIAVHRWGWAIALFPDGTVTATSPDRRRLLRSHGPPATAA